MKKSQIESIRIDITSQGQSALSILLHQDGTINRQGNGDLPPIKVAAMGMSDGSAFKKLVDLIPDEDPLLDESLEYKHPDLKGQPIEYKIIFMGQKPLMRQYHLYFGLENNEVHQIVKYFDHFVMNAKRLTEEMYQKAIDGDGFEAVKKKKPWWKF